MAFSPEEHFRILEREDKKTHKKIQSNYLDVKWRILWFREENPKGKILSTEEYVGPMAKVAWENSQKVTKEFPGARFFAEVYDGDGAILARSYASETADDFPDYYEKSETKAIGRALALAGFGTQFAEELEEDDTVPGSLADSPVEQKAPKPFTPATNPATTPTSDGSVGTTSSTPSGSGTVCGDCGDAVEGYVVKGKTVTPEELTRNAVALVGHPLCRKCYAAHKSAPVLK